MGSFEKVSADCCVFLPARYNLKLPRLEGSGCEHFLASYKMVLSGVCRHISMFAWQSVADNSVLGSISLYVYIRFL